MTETTILDDSPVSEIEARWKGRDINRASWDDIATLITTARALFSDNRDLRRSVEHWVSRYNDLEEWRAQTAASLEQLRAERDALQKGLKEHCRCGQQGACRFCVIQREAKP